MTNQKQAMLYGLGTVLLWSTVATAFKLSLSNNSFLEPSSIENVCPDRLRDVLQVVHRAEATTKVCPKRSMLGEEDHAAMEHSNDVERHLSR